MVFFVEANSDGFEVPITHLPFTLKVSKKILKALRYYPAVLLSPAAAIPQSGQKWLRARI